MDANALPDGIHEGVPFADYLGIPAVSNSGVLKKMRRSPLYCHATEGVEDESSPDMRMGSCLNDLVLVPHLWPERFTVVGRCSATLKQGGACRNTARGIYGGHPCCGTHADGEPDDTGRILVSEDAAARAKDMADAVAADEHAAALLARCPSREVTLLWTDRTTGLRCKGRVDFYGDHPIKAEAGDLKKSAAAHPDRFPSEMMKRGYHGQCAWYDAGFRAHGRYIDQWSLLVVNDVKGDDVHEVGVYPLIADALELGRAQNRETLSRYAECKRSGKWGGFGVVPMSVPYWAIGRDDNEDGAAEGATEVE